LTTSQAAYRFAPYSELGHKTMIQVIKTSKLEDAFGYKWL